MALGVQSDEKRKSRDQYLCDLLLGAGFYFEGDGGDDDLPGPMISASSSSSFLPILRSKTLKKPARRRASVSEVQTTGMMDTRNVELLRLKLEVVVLGGPSGVGLVLERRQVCVEERGGRCGREREGQVFIETTRERVRIM